MIETAALKALADAAHEFALKWKPRPKVTGAYERALNKLVQVARAYATKSDEQWASEVAALREEVRRLHEPMVDTEIVSCCKCELCDFP